jgi:hypothetical protein
MTPQSEAYGREKLLALAERVEALTEASREVDGAIDRLLNDRPKDGDYDSAEQAIWQVRDGWSGLLVRGDGFARDSFSATPFTASIDAAMTLVPEGWWAEVGARGSYGTALLDGHNEGSTVSEFSSAATPALALTAACLRARALASEPR